MQLVRLFRSTQTPKTFATISRFFIVMALIGCIIFYNVSVDDDYYINTLFTTFFKVLMLFAALETNILACKWFLSQNRSSCHYYQVVNLLLVASCVAISGRHLWIIGGALLVIMFLNILLTMLCDAPEERFRARKISISYGFVFVLLLGIGIGLLETQPSFYQLGVCLLVGSVMLILGAAPFHWGQMFEVRWIALPSVAFFSCVQPITGIAVLLNLAKIYGGEAEQVLQTMFLLFGILSIIFGAIGVSQRKSLYVLFFCVGLFNLGAVLISFSWLNNEGIQAGITYFLIYILSMFGIYSCCYGGRSHGEYLRALEDIKGIAEVKPYIASGMLIFCASLLGIPPLLGVIGNISLVDILLKQHGFHMLGLVFFCFVIMAYGLLQLIKTLYFDKRNHHFDRIDKIVYIALYGNMILLLYAVINPNWLVQNVKIITESFWK